MESENNEQWTQKNMIPPHHPKKEREIYHSNPEIFLGMFVHSCKLTLLFLVRLLQAIPVQQKTKCIFRWFYQM